MTIELDPEDRIPRRVATLEEIPEFARCCYFPAPASIGGFVLDPQCAAMADRYEREAPAKIEASIAERHAAADAKIAKQEAFIRRHAVARDLGRALRRAGCKPQLIELAAAAIEQRNDFEIQQVGDDGVRAKIVRDGRELDMDHVVGEFLASDAGAALRPPPAPSGPGAIVVTRSTAAVGSIARS